MTSRDHAAQVERRPLCDQQPPTRSVQLNRAAAARWLSQLERMLAADNEAWPCLKELRNNLEDECWLARWKREEVIVELCPSDLPSLLEELMRISHPDQPAEELRVLEEIIQALSRVNVGATTKS